MARDASIGDNGQAMLLLQQLLIDLLANDNHTPVNRVDHTLVNVVDHTRVNTVDHT